MRFKRRGLWHDITAAEHAQTVARAAAGLGARAGMRAGVLGHNRYEWVVADHALRGAGAEVVALDATADEVPGGLELIVCEDEEQVDKAAGSGATLVVVDDRGVRDASIRRWADVIAAEPADGVSPPGRVEGRPEGPGDRVLSFLPMHSEAERAAPLTGAVVHFGEGVFEQDLRDVQPTVLAGPPALFERMREQVEQRMRGASRLKRRAYAAGDPFTRRALRRKLGLADARLLLSHGDVDADTLGWFEWLERPVATGERP